MNTFKTYIWGVWLRIIFRCACIAFTITRMPIRGALVLIWYQEKILIVRKSYKKGWSIPGGILKRGETWQQAAVRETFEEVGIHLKEKSLVFIKEVPGDLGPRDRARLFEVLMESSPTVKIDEREIVSAKFVTPEEAMQRNLYQHVKTYLRTRIGQ